MECGDTFTTKIPSTGAQVLLADATCCIAAKSCGELGEDVESVVHFGWLGDKKGMTNYPATKRDPY